MDLEGFAETFPFFLPEVYPGMKRLISARQA